MTPLQMAELNAQVPDGTESTAATVDDALRSLSPEEVSENARGPPSTKQARQTTQPKTPSIWANYKQVIRAFNGFYKVI